MDDSGLLHALLNLRTMADLEGHSKAGASWEGFVLGETVRRLGAEPEECFFWAPCVGAELDVLVVGGSVKFPGVGSSPTWGATAFSAESGRHFG